MKAAFRLGAKAFWGAGLLECHSVLYSVARGLREIRVLSSAIILRADDGLLSV